MIITVKLTLSVMSSMDIPGSVFIFRKSCNKTIDNKVVI